MAAVDDPKIRATLGKKNPIAVIAGAGVEVHHITGVEGLEALVVGDVVEGDHRMPPRVEAAADTSAGIHWRTS